MKKKKLKILMVSPEVYPYSTVGGLSQVTTFLSQSLEKRDHQVEVFTPFYGGGVSDRKMIINFYRSRKHFNTSKIYQGRKKDLIRFSSFGQALTRFLRSRKNQFDVVHSHDWYGALSFSQIKKEHPQIKTVLTVHSPLAADYSYKEEKPENLEDWTDNLVDFAPKDEFYPWKLALAGADQVTTVSPSYAREISPYFGKSTLPAIINGIDQTKFSLLGRKEEAKTALQRLFGLPVCSVPVFVYVGRIVRQKGIGILISAMRSMLAKEAMQFICLGEGEKDLTKGLFSLKKTFPEKVGLHLAKDFELPRAVFAGGDFMLQPSASEPCGITVLEGMKMGAIPVVRQTGGLKDLVKNEVTGLAFKDLKVRALEKTVYSALALYQNTPALSEIKQSAQKHIFTWDKSASKYEELYLAR